RLDVGAVEYVDSRVAAVTARQPGEPRPVGDGGVAEMHASFLRLSLEAERAGRRAVAQHAMTVHPRGAGIPARQHHAEAFAEAPGGPEEQEIREIEPASQQHRGRVRGLDLEPLPPREVITSVPPESTALLERGQVHEDATPMASSTP